MEAKLPEFLTCQGAKPACGGARTRALDRSKAPEKRGFHEVVGAAGRRDRNRADVDLSQEFAAAPMTEKPG
jgi:hypothetical protein